MSTKAISAKGAMLKRGDGVVGTEAFTEIAEVTNIGGLNLKQDTQDVTSHQSAGGWREFIGTLKDGGEMTLELNYVPTDDTQDCTVGIGLDFKNGTKRNFQMLFPDDPVEANRTKWSFAAFVTSYSVTAPHDGSLKGSISLKVTGVPTLQ